MKRFTDSVFADLRYWMIGLGLAAGLVFPLVLLLIGVSPALALRWTTFLGALAAGASIGWLNHRLASKVVRTELQVVVERMREVEEGVREASFNRDWSSCSAEHCTVPVGSDDEIGHTAEAFNALLGEVIHAHKMEAASGALTETLSTKLEIEALCHAAIELVLAQTGATAGCILVREEAELTVAANHGLSDVSRLPGSDHVRRALDTQQLQIVRIPRDIALEGVVTRFKPRQVLVVPVLYEGQALGVVVIASDAMLGKDAMWLVRLFQQVMGLALNNAVTHARLQRIAAIDPLTGVLNRRFGMRRLREEFQGAVRQGTPLGVVMFDIDHFKRVNDTYGHLAGDRVLAETARRAQGVLRESDVLLRYGGEEFVVIVPGAGEGALVAVAERIRLAIAATPVNDGGLEIPVTVSAGIGTLCGREEKEESLLKRADEALYAAKEGGRNRTVCLARTAGTPLEAAPVA
ncbi:MAG: sensor domain-containing diguanylate cyclase [Candidatus Latescibacteria bacterium]|nr:sensor domain-containing diguanylate cyclase [Candidatus Latescibacterota bacterium]